LCSVLCTSLTAPQGGAVFTFIGSAVSLPIAHLAFRIDWPLLGSAPLYWEDGLALVIVMCGLVGYRIASMKSDVGVISVDNIRRLWRWLIYRSQDTDSM
jgi:hypothetical protein